MKVTLIYCRGGHDVYPMAPLGVLYVAASLERAGHTVQVLDPFSAGPDLVEQVVSFGPDAIGLSLLTTHFRRAAALASDLRRAVPGALLFAGGEHPTALPSETIRELDLDFVVVGEGENTAVEACTALSEGRSLHGVAGVVFRSGSEIIENASRPLVEDLDAIPFPARHLLPFEDYLQPPGPFRGAYVERTATMMAGRGCPYRCIFCASNNIFGRRVRLRSPQNVVDEIQSLVTRYAIDSVYFLDDTFTLRPEWVLEFCRLLLDRGLRLKWGCQIRANTVEESLLVAMKRAGCIWVAVGVESGSEKVLRTLQKGTTPEMLRNAFRIIRKVGLISSATYVLGSPGETAEDVAETERLAKDIKADFHSFFFLTPFPGSALYGMAHEHQWLEPGVDYPDWDVRYADYPVMSIGFTREELTRIRARLQNEFFLHNYLSYLKRGRLLLRMLAVALSQPQDLLVGLGKLVRTGRLDDAAEAFLQSFRRNGARRRSSSRAMARERHGFRAQG